MLRSILQYRVTRVSKYPELPQVKANLLYASRLELTVALLTPNYVFMGARGIGAYLRDFSIMRCFSIFGVSQNFCPEGLYFIWQVELMYVLVLEPHFLLRTLIIFSFFKHCFFMPNNTFRSGNLNLSAYLVLFLPQF